MITRINLVKNEHNEIIIQNKEDIPKNWIVEIKNNQLIVVGLSKANPNRERVNLFELKEGSLFLYNSSFDFYCYFRKIEIQDILYEYGIQKVVAIEHKLNLTLHIINGEVTNPILYLNGFECVNSEKSGFVVKNDNKEYFQVKLDFRRTHQVSEVPFLIQQGKDEYNNILYIGKGKTLEEFNTTIKQEHRLYNNNEFIFTNV